MKKTRALMFLASLSFSLITTSCSTDSQVVKEKLNYDGSYNSVCVKGNLSYKQGANFLPKGFYGNYYDVGIAEIGGYAGDTSGSLLPTLTWNGSGRFMASIQFDDNITQFKQADFVGKLGFEMSVYVPGQGDIYLDGRKEAFNFEKLFTYNSVTNLYIYNSSFQDNPINPAMTYWPEGKSVLITFSMKDGYQLNYIRVTYSDQPSLITNAAIFSEVANPVPLMSQEYTDNDCSKDSYTVNVGSSPVYNLVSQYGTCYSKNFFLDSFVYKDEYDDDTNHVEIIEDPDQYFTLGSTAPIGSKFTIYLVAYDSSYNRSQVTINLTVADQRAPTLQQVSQGTIKASYQEVLDHDSFIDKYFLIKDNYDAEVDADFRLKSGSDFPNYQIGDFSCILEAEDSFGNESELEFTLQLYDDVPPQIIAQQTELILAPNKYMSEQAIINLFTAYDEVDKNIEVKITSNGYKGNENQIGVYAVKVQASDSSQNIATSSITIIVQDDEGPVFFAKESFITVTKGNVPSLDEVIESLIRQGIIPNLNYTEKSIIEGPLLDDSLEVGLHQMRLYLKAESGDEEMVLLSVKVVESSDLNVEDVSLSFWDKFINFFIELWNKIVAFFTGQ